MSRLHDRARELEDEIADARHELDQIYSELVVTDDDSFLMRVADRFRDERDQARREVAELSERISQLSSGEDDWEARFRATEDRFYQMRHAIARITNDPKMPRDQVQSLLLLAYEKVRDFTP